MLTPLLPSNVSDLRGLQGVTVPALAAQSGNSTANSVEFRNRIAELGQPRGRPAKLIYSASDPQIPPKPAAKVRLWAKPPV